MENKESILSIIEELLETTEEVKEYDYEVYESLKNKIEFIEDLIQD